MLDLDRGREHERQGQHAARECVPQPLFLLCLSRGARVLRDRGSDRSRTGVTVAGWRSPNGGPRRIGQRARQGLCQDRQLLVRETVLVARIDHDRVEVKALAEQRLVQRQGLGDRHLFGSADGEDRR